MKRKLKLTSKGNGINFYWYDKEWRIFEVKKSKGGWFFICKLNENGELIQQGEPLKKNEFYFGK